MSLWSPAPKGSPARGGDDEVETAAAAQQRATFQRTGSADSSSPRSPTPSGGWFAESARAAGLGAQFDEAAAAAATSAAGVVPESLDRQELRQRRAWSPGSAAADASRSRPSASASTPAIGRKNTRPARKPLATGLPGGGMPLPESQDLRELQQRRSWGRQDDGSESPQVRSAESLRPQAPASPATGRAEELLISELRRAAVETSAREDSADAATPAELGSQRAAAVAALAAQGWRVPGAEEWPESPAGQASHGYDGSTDPRFSPHHHGRSAVTFADELAALRPAAAAATPPAAQTTLGILRSEERV